MDEAFPRPLSQSGACRLPWLCLIRRGVAATPSPKGEGRSALWGTLCVERRQVGSMGYLVYRGESRGLREKKGVGEREEESG